jgi:hypothetical protein
MWPSQKISYIIQQLISGINYSISEFANGALILARGLGFLLGCDTVWTQYKHSEGTYCHHPWRPKHYVPPKCSPSMDDTTLRHNQKNRTVIIRPAGSYVLITLCAGWFGHIPKVIILMDFFLNCWLSCIGLHKFYLQLRAKRSPVGKFKRVTSWIVYHKKYIPEF